MNAGSASTVAPTNSAQAFLLDLVASGKDTPEDIVRAAEPVTSPIHSYFEWDDADAAHQYRIHQARKLIARVKITTLVGHEKVAVRAVVNVKDERGDHYVTVEDHRDDPGFQAQMIRRYTEELKQLLVKYAYLLNDEETVKNLSIDVMDEIFD